MAIEIKYLADHPELTHQLAGWLVEEWGKGNPSMSVELVEQRLRERSNRDKIPMVLVAFDDSEPVGTTTLKIQEMETYPQFEHWLGNVYVRPQYRNRGFASQLVEYSAGEAKRLGVRELYLFTTFSERLYARLGWRVIERPTYNGRVVAVMKRELIQ